MNFFIPFIRLLLNEGHRVDLAANEKIKKVQICYREWGCKIHPITCSRTPFKIGNITAIKQIRKIVNENNYNLVHCHTPIAAVCARIACRKLRKSGVKVIYTTHGFHFYKGAPLINWIIYYPIEKLCSHWTDVLITINKEDYIFAREKMMAKKIEYIPGVGIDIDKFRNTVVDIVKKRSEIGVPKDSFLLLSVGELNKNKNHELVIRAIAKMKNPNIHYVIAGIGSQHKHLRNLANKLGITDQLHLLGYREDVAELYKASDAYAHPSFREGLSVSIMEAMASGLPVICSKIRGNIDLIDENGGFLFSPHSVDECKWSIENLLKYDTTKFGLYNQKKINGFALNFILEKMQKIYKECEIEPLIRAEKIIYEK